MSGHELTMPSAEWLPLLRQLTGSSESWGIWKNTDRALAGSGDVDSAAPTRDHAELATLFYDWAEGQGLQWVIECVHAEGVLALIAVSESTWAQLDVAAESSFRGTRLFTAEDLVPLMVMDQRGFRRIREGAEGLLLFLYKGIRWGGRRMGQGLEKYGVLQKMAGDWEGTEEAITRLGLPRAPMVRAIRAAARGRWERFPLIHAEAVMMMRGLAHPRFLLSRAASRGWGMRQCDVLKAIGAAHRISVPTWLEDVRANHTVTALPASRRS
ncbi:MAG TPA: hypothetical protein VF058_02170 [Actinomycetota bacterium]